MSGVALLGTITPSEAMGDVCFYTKRTTEQAMAKADKLS
jgi:hypothetical protein